MTLINHNMYYENLIILGDSATITSKNLSYNTSFIKKLGVHIQLCPKLMDAFNRSTRLKLRMNEDLLIKWTILSCVLFLVIQLQPRFEIFSHNLMRFQF